MSKNPTSKLRDNEKAVRKYKPATRCKNASNYKAMWEPRCGCDVCAIKWQIADMERRLTKEIQNAGFL